MISRRTLLIGLAVSGQSHACPVDQTAAAEPAGWTLVSVPNRRVARFAAGPFVPGPVVPGPVVPAPIGTIAIAADNAVGFLLRPVPIGTGARDRVTWRWRVDAAPPATSPADKGRDDRPVAIQVIYREAGDSDGILDDVRRWLFGVLVHDAYAGRVLTYMWGGTLPAGTRLQNPYRPGDGAIIVLRAAESPLGRWQTETVDPAADYRWAFGRDAPAPTHIALSADTEDSGGCALAQVEPPIFLPSNR